MWRYKGREIWSHAAGVATERYGGPEARCEGMKVWRLDVDSGVEIRRYGARESCRRCADTCHGHESQQAAGKELQVGRI